MNKPKIGFYGCASCGGCEESVVDLAEELLKVVAQIEFVFFPVAMDFKRSDVEAMASGEMAVCFVNGAIRSSEQREMAELLRAKAGILVAYGSCACHGGIPGLANLSSLEALLGFVYSTAPSVGMAEPVRPQARVACADGESVSLPVLDEQVRCLDEVVRVDYYVPGCAPPVEVLKKALGALLSRPLPPVGPSWRRTWRYAGIARGWRASQKRFKSPH